MTQFPVAAWLSSYNAQVIYLRRSAILLACIAVGIAMDMFLHRTVFITSAHWLTWLGIGSTLAMAIEINGRRNRTRN